MVVTCKSGARTPLCTSYPVNNTSGFFAILIHFFKFRIDHIVCVVCFTLAGTTLIITAWLI
jgi:hypothetical protein